MTKFNFDTVFFSFFFFIQGIFLTVIIMIATFNYKVIPTIREKDFQIEKLTEKLMGGTKNKEHSHSGNSNNRKIYEVKPGVVITI